MSHPAASLPTDCTNTKIINNKKYRDNESCLLALDLLFRIEDAALLENLAHNRYCRVDGVRDHKHKRVWTVFGHSLRQVSDNACIDLSNYHFCYNNVTRERLRIRNHRAMM